MATCAIFGGTGFIGTHLARHFLSTMRFDRIVLADIRSGESIGDARVSAVNADVRRPIPVDLCPERPEWIFNLAAVHREPGHAPSEYFDTNLAGAENVCRFADAVGCRRIYFTSSISVYGPTSGPTSEVSSIRPISPYGGSKYPAEWIHRTWLAARADRRLVICRPGVVYGPGDPGNILRMVRAVKRGYFAFPGSPGVFKSYGYIHGMLDSVDFVMSRFEPLTIYNYVETPTEPLEALVKHVKSFLGSRAPVLSLPLPLLLPAAKALHLLLGEATPMHPVRVRKAGMPTHIVPGWLQEHGFVFRYPFEESLRHWSQTAPEDFR